MNHSPLTMTVAERKRRWAWWKRHYPNVAAWLAAHPGEAAGRVLLNGCKISYYRLEVDTLSGRKWGPIAWTLRPLGEGQVAASCEEYRREVLGLPKTAPPCNPMPTWPPTPEKRGRRGKRTNGNGEAAFSDFALAGNRKGL